MTLQCRETRQWGCVSRNSNVVKPVRQPSKKHLSPTRAHASDDRCLDQVAISKQERPASSHLSASPVKRTESQAQPRDENLRCEVYHVAVKKSKKKVGITQPMPLEFAAHFPPWVQSGGQCQALRGRTRARGTRWLRSRRTLPDAR
jgi:hypothetical protein